MIASAIFFVMYIANGIVCGSLVGLKEHEHYLQLASIRANWALPIALVLQVIVIAMTMLSLTRRHSEIPAFSLEHLPITLWYLVISVAIAILGTGSTFWLILKIAKIAEF
jgi:hypothetical protein